MSDTGVGSLTCPKCQGSMRQYERSGITIDQCSDCRGIFLDAGELERLMEAEDAHYRQAPPPPQPTGYPPPDPTPSAAASSEESSGAGTTAAIEEVTTRFASRIPVKVHPE